MSANSVWQPIGVGGFRLYKVVVFFPERDCGALGKIKAGRKHLIAAGLTPTDAAARVLATYRNMPDAADITAKGFALSVLQPASWREEGIPEPDDKRFGKWL